MEPAYGACHGINHANSSGLGHHEQHISNKCGRWVKPLEDHAKGESPGLLAVFFKSFSTCHFYPKNHQTQETSLDFSEDLAKVKKT